MREATQLHKALFKLQGHVVCLLGQSIFFKRVDSDVMLVSMETGGYVLWD